MSASSVRRYVFDVFVSGRYRSISNFRTDRPLLPGPRTVRLQTDSIFTSGLPRKDL